MAGSSGAFGTTRAPPLGNAGARPAFVERLVRFEQVVVDVARKIDGRAPSRRRHFGAYDCRSMRQRAARISEHALGNPHFDMSPWRFVWFRAREPRTALPSERPRSGGGARLFRWEWPSARLASQAAL